MKDIIIIQDGENYHVFLGDTGIWLNAGEMERLKAGVSQYMTTEKQLDEYNKYTYEAGKYYRFECENGLTYIALLIEDDGKGNLRFRENIAWDAKHKKMGCAEYCTGQIPLVLTKRSCTVLVPATDKEMNCFDEVKDEYLNRIRFEIFQKVLVRDREDECWFPAIFVKYRDKKEFPYKCLLLDTGASTGFKFCEPYEGNENAAYDDKEILPF